MQSFIFTLPVFSCQQPLTYIYNKLCMMFGKNKGGYINTAGISAAHS
jgi:hypothetical protein